jgi:hypothetical protein
MAGQDVQTGSRPQGRVTLFDRHTPTSRYVIRQLGVEIGKWIPDLFGSETRLDSDPVPVCAAYLCAYGTWDTHQPPNIRCRGIAAKGNAVRAYRVMPDAHIIRIVGKGRCG